MAKALEDLIREKLRILTSADKELVDAIESTEKALFTKIKSVLAGLEQQGGKLLPGQEIRGIQRQLVKAFESSTLPRRVSKYLQNFDQVEKLNREITEGLTGQDLSKVKLNREKRAIIDQVATGLDARDGIRVNIIQPLTKTLTTHVTQGTSVAEAEHALRVFIGGDDAGRGHLSRYVRQLAMDAINQYDGAINQKVADQLELEAFAYVGSLINTSRNTCIDLVNGAGAYADLAIEPGIYPMAAIPEIVNRSQGADGWNPLTTPGTFFVYRGGFNCRHMTQPISLDLKQREQIQEAKGAIESEETTAAADKVIDSLPTDAKALRQAYDDYDRHSERLNDVYRRSFNGPADPEYQAALADRLAAGDRIREIGRRISNNSGQAIVEIHKLAKPELQIKLLDKFSETIDETIKPLRMRRRSRTARLIAELEREKGRAQLLKTKIFDGLDTLADINGNSRFREFVVKDLKKERPELVEMLTTHAAGRDKRQAIVDEIDQLIQELTQLDDQTAMDALQAKIAAKWKEAGDVRLFQIDEWRAAVIKGREAATMKVEISVRDKATRDKMQGAVEWLQKFVGKGVADNIETTTKKVRNRSYYDIRKNEVRVAVENGVERATVHELGHFIEAKNQGLFRRSVDFLEQRVGNDRPTRIYQWSSKEVGVEDDFLSHYMGREYKTKSKDLYAYKERYATEILSMGLESIYNNPVEFYRRDPDMFNFIWSLFNQ